MFKDMKEISNMVMDSNMGEGLANALSKYSYSIYPTNGRFGIAFFFDDLQGKKARKVITSKNEEELLAKRTEFISNLYYKKIDIEEKAKQVQAEITQPAASIRYIQPEKNVCSVTIEEAIDKFLVYYKPLVSYQTYLGEVTSSNYIKKVLGSHKVSEVTFEDFQTLVNNTSKRKDNKGKEVIAAEKTVRNIIISFKRLMRHCSKNKWISVEDVQLIISDIKIPTFITDSDHEEIVKASKFLNYEETGEVLRILENNKRYYLVVRILYLTGLRPQEFFGLEKEDLFPEEHYINVRQALVVQEKQSRNDRGYDIGTTKNKGSRRKVPAIAEVFYYFDELEKLMVESGIRKKAIANGNENLIILDDKGNIVNVHYFGVNLVKCIKNKSPQNIVKRILTLNMPRHCYQDYLDKLGAKDSDVEKAVGHIIHKVSEKNYKTQEIYVQRLLPFLEQMAEDIEEAYKTIPKTVK